MEEKHKIVIDYSGSGVKFLRILSVILCIIGIVFVIGSCALLAIGETISVVNGEIVKVTPWAYVICGFFSSIIVFFLSAIAKSISVITENSLIQKSIIENEYEIKELEK